MKVTIAIAAAALAMAAPQAFAQSSTGSDNTSITAEALKPVSTDEFVKKASSANRLEIESSKLALEQGVSDEVKQFAQKMVDDHTKAGEEMKAALEQTDMTSATGESDLLPEHQAALDALKGAEGDGFEKAYVDMQLKAHDEAVKLFGNYAENGEQDALVSFAEKTLPTLKEHHEMIAKIAEGQG
jgi:putative membrane protein